jgi:hypothetical protein
MKCSSRKEFTPKDIESGDCGKTLSKDKADKPINTVSAEQAALKVLRDAWEGYKSTAS